LMARRRLQVTGGGSYVLTLPKEWVKRHGLGRGAEVVVSVEPDGSLRVSPAGGGRRRRRWTASLRFPGGAGAETVLRRVISFYIAGADVVEVEFEGSPRPGLVADVKRLVSSKLLGVEVVEESSRRITFQVVGDESMSGMDAFNRLTKTVEHMLSDIVLALREGQGELLREVPQRDDIVDKLFIYVWRQVSSLFLGKRGVGEVGFDSYVDASVYMMAAKHAERIGDHASRLAGALAGGEQAEGLVEPLDEVTRLYRESVQLLNRPRPERAEELIQRLESLRLGLDPRRGAAWESVRRIADYCTDLLELSLNRASIALLIGGGGG